MLRRIIEMSRTQKVLLLTLTIIISYMVVVSFNSKLKLKYPCNLDQEELFTGQKWTLKLLTTLYKPYREYKPYVRHSITAYKIEYPSVINGKKMTLSGTLIIPHNYQDPLPILVYCHGTLFNKIHAPSNWNSAINIEAMPSMSGFITFIPDYLGYGSTEGEIPAYFNQELTVQTIADMLPTGLNNLKECGIPYKNELFILGYSQGGHAAVSLMKEMESRQALTGDLELKATVSIAAPFRLNDNVRYIVEKDTFASSAYVSYLFLAMNEYQWHRDMSEFFKDSSLYYITEHLKGNITLNQMALNQSDAIHELMNEKFLNDFLGDNEDELKYSLEGNCNFNFIPETPLLVVHSKVDEIVPFVTSYSTWKTWDNNGANSELVKFHSLEYANHSESAFEGMTIGLDYLNEYR